MQDGRRLAELRRYATELLPEYNDWVISRGYPAEQGRLNFHRSLVGWYEATLQAERPYTGDIMDYVTTVAAVYFADGQVRSDRFPMGNGPLDHLPKPVQLDERGQRMLVTLNQDDDCRQLLLLADYHQMEPAVIARALDREATLEDLPDEIADCRDAVTGDDPETALRYPSVIRIAGRQDLMATLAREAPDPEPDPESDTAAPEATAPVRDIEEESEEVKLRPRRRVKLPSLSVGMLIAAILCGVLGWLAYDTFGGAAPTSLYTRAFEPYPNLFATTPPQTDDERDLNRILYYYDRGDYRTAYDELLPTAPAYPAAPLYLGVSALALDDPTRARQWFAELDATSPYRDAAEWYDALALLALDRRDAGLAALGRIADSPGHPFAGRAGELLRG
ncbi:hypothetical protein [Lewinella sp. IMCC34191]|uniref:hypothetical protein n=1 Tax=Lewinella sp. IMCC34191 TaxID=2259172 RepID=UPI000E2286DB|nr:hypothetical protein [Lewinella sp. IMCC34191]